jgi:3-phenylpropionate/cinnamic acid dioxygenase small subunit
VIPIEDAVSIHDVLAMYGHLVDDRAWDRMHEIFTEDFVFRSSTGAVYSSRDELLAFWTSDAARHPDGHHVSNAVLTLVDEDTVDALSKGLYVHSNGTVTTAVYRDVLCRTTDGWRLAARTVAVP